MVARKQTVKKEEWARPNPPESTGEKQTKKKRFLPYFGLRRSNLFLTKNFLYFSFFFHFLRFVNERFIVKDDVS